MTLERMVKEMMSNDDKGNWLKFMDNLSDEKISFNQFVKKFNAEIRLENKGHILPYMKDKYYRQLYEKSGFAKSGQTNTSKDVKNIAEKSRKPKIITVKRKGKSYKRTTSKRWDPSTKISVSYASGLKLKSKEYYEVVGNIVSSTGKTEQAVKKKIQRFRKQNKKTIKSKG